jgi:peptidyl-prolyl cis-trans isomerase SurA
MSTRKTALLSILFLSLNTFSQDKKIIDQVVAIIGKQVILQSEIENQCIQLKAQGYYTSSDLQCEVLEEILDSKLLVNQAILDSVEVKDADVNRELERRLNYFINQIGSEEKLEEYYKKSIAEIKEEFRDIIKDQLLSQQMVQKVTADITVTPQEVRAYYKSLDKDSIPMINTQFEIDQIAILPKVAETEILRIKEQLREYKTRVTNGESFATLAVLYSEDTRTAVKGGELGFVGRGDLVPEFSAVAFNLEPGEVSKVVRTDEGYHIIQLIEKKGERINCRQILLRPKISATEKMNATLKLDSIRTSVMNHQYTFKEACWKYSEDENSRMNGGVMVNPYTGNSLYEADQLDPKVANAISRMEVGQISQPFEAIDEMGRPVLKIVQLRNKIQPHKANLDNDYQLLQDKAIERKKGEFMLKWVAQKIKLTYIKIDDTYKNCSFQNKAWKNLQP